MTRAVVSCVKLAASSSKFLVLLECGHGSTWHLERDADERPPKFLACQDCES